MVMKPLTRSIWVLIKFVYFVLGIRLYANIDCFIEAMHKKKWHLVISSQKLWITLFYPVNLRANVEKQFFQYRKDTL